MKLVIKLFLIIVLTVAVTLTGVYLYRLIRRDTDDTVSDRELLMGISRSEAEAYNNDEIIIHTCSDAESQSVGFGTLAIDINKHVFVKEGNNVAITETGYDRIVSIGTFDFRSYAIELGRPNGGLSSIYRFSGGHMSLIAEGGIRCINSDGGIVLGGLMPNGIAYRINAAFDRNMYLRTEDTHLKTRAALVLDNDAVLNEGTEIVIADTDLNEVDNQTVVYIENGVLRPGVLEITRFNGSIYFLSADGTYLKRELCF